MNQRFVLFGSLMGFLGWAIASEAATYLHGYNNCSISIPDKGAAVSAQVTLSGAPNTAKISNVKVYYEVKHTFIGDLKVWVTAYYSGGWHDYMLKNREGGSADNIAETRDNLSAWNGASPNQTWYLSVQDCSGGDTGLIDFFEIWVTYTVPTPKGNLEVTVRTVSGSATSGAKVLRYRSGSALDQKTTNSSGKATWSDIDTGTYMLEAYYTGTSWGEEYWASETASVSESATATLILNRTYPCIEAITLKNNATGATIDSDDAIASDTVVRVIVTVRNRVNQSLSSRVHLRLDRDKSNGYDFEQTSGWKTVSASGTQTFDLGTFTPSQTGTWYRSAEVTTQLSNGNQERTDGWWWSQGFISRIPTGNLEVTVKNQANSAVRGARVVRYNSGGVTDQATSNSSGKVTWTAIPTGSYKLEAYYTGTFWGEEYWGDGTQSVSTDATASITIKRIYPYVESVTLKADNKTLTSNSSIPAGKTVSADVVVRNDVSQALNVQVRFLMDRDQASPYEQDQTSAWQSISGGGTGTIHFECPLASVGTWLRALEVKTDLANGSIVRTDAWGWDAPIITTAANTMTLSISHTGQGTVTLNPVGGVYTENTVVTMTAEPADGWHFVQWQGDVTGTSNSKQVTMTANKNVTAVFEENTSPYYTLDVACQGVGSVNINPGSDSYPEGTVVTLTAQMTSGWHFVRWTGANTTTDNPIQVSMTDNKSVTAIFAADTGGGRAISIADSGVAQNSEIEVPIFVDNPEDIAGFQFTVVYDPAVLEATDNAETGSLTNSTGWIIQTNRTTSGQIRLQGISNPLAGLAAGSSGSLAKLVFQVIGTAGRSTSLTFNEAKLSDISAGEIACSAAAGNLTILTGSSGALKVTLTPEGIPNAGARWMVDGGTENESGVTQTLSEGTHRITFKDIDGWVTPEAVSVSVTSGNIRSVSGQYIPRGDINNDGLVDLYDVILAMRISVKLPVSVENQTIPSPYSTPVRKRANMNADDEVDLFDVIPIMKKSVGSM
jgi:subtilisin-like proprotein convertase family protein